MKVNRRIFSLSFCMLIIFSVLSITGSASEKLTVNGEKVSKGDTVTFSYYISGVSDPIEAAGAYLSFNPEFLECIEDSVGFDVLHNAMKNVNDDSIYYCAIDVKDGFDFKEEGLVITASFRVLNTAKGSTVITNTFDEIFTFENEDEDLTPDDYTSRTVISVNDPSVAALYSGVNADDVTGGQSAESNLASAVIVIVIAAVVVLAAAGAFILVKKKKSDD